MKYTAEFSTFESALVAQGDLLSLREDGVLVHGYRGPDWQEAASKEILEIAKSLDAASWNDDGTFWAEVTLDSKTGAVTKRGLYRCDPTGCGYGRAEKVK